ncbi:PQQ-like beta-propeller repeat protein [bacterium]|nr:PQQ-like beta-propeller repeat protein [bacterium]
MKNTDFLRIEKIWLVALFLALSSCYSGNVQNFFSWKKPVTNSWFSRYTIDNGILYCTNNDIWLGIDIDNDDEILKESKVETIALVQKDLVIYYTYDEQKNKEDLFLAAYNKRTKQTVWRHQMVQPRSGAIALYNDLVLYGSYEGFIYAIQIDNGQVRWRFSFQEAIGDHYYQHNDEVLKYYLEKGDTISLSSDLFVYQDMLFCYYDGEKTNYFPDNDGLLYAINLTTHSLQWSVLTPWPIISDLYFAKNTNNQDAVFFSTADGKIYDVEIASGNAKCSVVMKIKEKSYPFTGNLIGVTQNQFLYLYEYRIVMAIPKDNLFGVAWEIDLSKLGSELSRFSFFYLYHLVVTPELSTTFFYDFLVLKNETDTIFCLDCSTGQLVFEWKSVNEADSGWNSVVQYQNNVIASDEKGIYVLDLERVISTWLKKKETIQLHMESIKK